MNHIINSSKIYVARPTKTGELLALMPKGSEGNWRRVFERDESGIPIKVTFERVV